MVKLYDRTIELLEHIVKMDVDEPIVLMNIKAEANAILEAIKEAS